MTFAYLGRLGRFQYHRVEVRYQHDAPGSILINPENGKAAYIHNGSSIVALAPDETRLISFDPILLPLSFAVATLSPDGPSFELRCVFSKLRGGVLQFRGWQNAESFDLVLKASASDRSPPIPIRVELKDEGLTVSVPDPSLMETEYGLTCGR